MKGFQRLSQAATRYYVASNGETVYRVRRIKSADVVAVGFAHLVGHADVDAAVKELRKAQRGPAPEDMTPEQREKYEKDAAFNEQAAFKKWLEAMGKTPERQQAYGAKVDAVVCAGVTGLGFLDEPAAPGPYEVGDLKIKVCDGDPAVCECDGIHKVRVVSLERDSRPEAGVGWVATIHEIDRLALAGVINSLSGVQAAITPFRRGAQPGADRA